MKLSALDIRKQEFARTFRGYDPEEVESFLQVVSTGWQELVDDLRRAQEKINEQQMKLGHYMKVEEALEEALQTARSSARQTIESAERKASDLLQEAENRIVSLQRDADANRLEVKRETARYAVRQQEIVAKLRAFLVSEMEMLRHFETDTGERTLAGGAPRKEIEMFREDQVPEPLADTPSDSELEQDSWDSGEPVDSTVDAEEPWAPEEEEMAQEEARLAPEDDEGDEDWEEEDEYDEEDEDWDDEVEEYEDEEEEDAPEDLSPGWKVTPVFESAEDEEPSGRPLRPEAGRFPDDSADDEIRKIHEILKGLDEEQDADDV